MFKSTEQASGRNQMVAEKLLNVKEAALALRVSVPSLYRLMERGELAYTKVGNRRLIPQAALDRLVSENAFGPNLAEPAMAG